MDSQETQSKIFGNTLMVALQLNGERHMPARQLLQLPPKADIFFSTKLKMEK